MDNELVPQPSWWKRNWKWVLPLGGCMTLIVLFVIFVSSIFFGVTKMFEESAPYEYALEKINNDDQMIELMGSPIEKDGIMSGNYEWKNGVKSADMSIPISGPKNSGTLYIRATGEGEEWTYHEIRVVVRDSEEFDLLESDWE
ncbi:cytochrome c oxidase assembly factor Coa1 family protein [Poritiphilus flavus]|uniref:Cytochrome oxidase complex assembly protein 1 n=1 Tax=Poritiphilus flavus TaxID=2697053 RepID=A0A6L9EE41_9FLAO|nr:cytochrome c oxidase assembly factor Coa1 family protein [Poritiphilus flavus]NAS12609.1 hypothetical protein [Poritiphilus flavus]